MFDLNVNKVHAIVSGMMLNDELKASWNQPTGTIVMHHVEPTSLQSSVLRFSQRVGSLLESNESLLESRHGNFGYSGKGGRDDYNQNQRGGGGGGGDRAPSRGGHQQDDYGKSDRRGYGRNNDDRTFDDDEGRSLKGSGLKKGSKK